MSNARDTNPVRLAREAAGLLLIDLARLSGKSPGLISQIEGGYVPKLPTMLAIAGALDTTPLVLWPDEVEAV
jgi:transcriptional regulator with XRE-family HTH domain